MTAEIEAARLLPARLGVRPEDLLAGAVEAPARGTRPVPTVAEYLPRVVAAVSPGARAAYAAYWRRLDRRGGWRSP
jgi:hypothetical protein